MGVKLDRVNVTKRSIEMAKYIDGFVLVVPKGKEAEYQKMGGIPG